MSSEDLGVCLDGISYIAGNLWFLKQTKKRTAKSQYIYLTDYAMFGVPAGLCSNDNPLADNTNEATTEGSKHPFKISKKTDLVKLLPFHQSENQQYYCQYVSIFKPIACLLQ